MGAIFKKELSEEQLSKLFASDDLCLKFLASVKWEDGFVCRKCGNTNYCHGKTPTHVVAPDAKLKSRRLRNHIPQLQIPLHKAYIAYNVQGKGGALNI